MGVRRCNRTACEEIMCDVLILEHYVCRFCLEDFKKSVGDEKCSERELFSKFLEFMNTPKMPGRTDKFMSVDDFILRNNSQFSDDM